MKPYAKRSKGTDTKGWKSFSGPHANRANKVRVDKKSARQEAKKIIKKEQE